MSKKKQVRESFPLVVAEMNQFGNYEVALVEGWQNLSGNSRFTNALAVIGVLMDDLQDFFFNPDED